MDLVPEDASHHGRLDLRLRFDGQIWLFEFKVVELAPEGGALAQIKACGYAYKYRAEGLPIHLCGIDFSRPQRTLVGFEVETHHESRGDLTRVGLPSWHWVPASCRDND